MRDVQPLENSLASWQRANFMFRRGISQDFQGGIDRSPITNRRLKAKGHQNVWWPKHRFVSRVLQIRNGQHYRCPLRYLAPQVGLEPTTLRLTAECSAIELLRNECVFIADHFKQRQPHTLATPHPLNFNQTCARKRSARISPALIPRTKGP